MSIVTEAFGSDSVAQSAVDRVRLARELFPDLAARLDDALRRNASTDDVDVMFDRALDDVATEMFADAGLGAIANTDGGARLSEAFRTVSQVISRVADTIPALRLPEPEAFAADGYDLTAIAELLEGEPLLSVVPAPYRLGLRGWETMFAAAQQAPGSPFTGDRALLIATEVRQEFESLDKPASQTAPNVNGNGPGWTLRLIPTSPAPPQLGMNFRNSGPHPTLPEMLMLQLMRAERHEPLLDGGEGGASFTWLSGSLAEGRLAARHVWDAEERAIRITAREIGSQGPHLGARPVVTVWADPHTA